VRTDPILIARLNRVRRDLPALERDLDIALRHMQFLTSQTEGYKKAAGTIYRLAQQELSEAAALIRKHERAMRDLQSINSSSLAREVDMHGSQAIARRVLKLVTQIESVMVEFKTKTDRIMNDPAAWGDAAGPVAQIAFGPLITLLEMLKMSFQVSRKRRE
jgi:oligoendopeptidase F